MNLHVSLFPVITYWCKVFLHNNVWPSAQSSAHITVLILYKPYNNFPTQQKTTVIVALILYET